jgi:CHAD domain-containing protein
MGGASSGGGSTTEREVKLGAGPGFELPDLGGAVPGGEVVALGEVALDAVYHDTADLRLARLGTTLRHRTGEGAARWTLKLPAGPGLGAGGGSDRSSVVLRRRELDVEAPGPPAPPPAELAELVAAHVRTAALAPVARLRTRRRRHELRDAAGQAVAEVDDDQVEVVHDDGPDGEQVVARFREIEVELVGQGDEAVLVAAAAVLRTAGAGPPDQVPKLVRALGPRALAPPELVVPELAPDAPVVDVVRTALTASVARLVDHDHVVRLDDDPEGVHRARVGARQLRSHLRTFAPVLASGWPGDELVGELRWVGAALGEVRDADVLGARLAESVAALPPDDAVAAGAVVDRLRAQRAERLDALLVAMRGRRYLELLDRLVAVAAAPELAEPDAPGADVARQLVRRPWRKLRKAARRLGPDGGEGDDRRHGGDPSGPSDAELHRVRILAKRARYACVAVAPVAPGPAAELADALADLQDELGELQDAVVAEAWLRGQVVGAGTGTADPAAALSPAEAVAVGQLVAAERRRAQAQRAAWWASWKAADRKALAGWLR